MTMKAKEEMYSEELSDMKPDNTIETVLVNSSKTVPCPELQKVPETVKVMRTPFLDILDEGQVICSSGCEEIASDALIVKEEMNLEQLSEENPESVKVMGTPFLDIHDVGQVISSSGCEEMTSNAFIVKEEMNLEQLRDVKPDNLNETVLVNVNETVPCPKLQKSINDMGTPFIFVGVKMEIPGDYENEAFCGNLGTQNSSQVNSTNHDREYKGVDECSEGTSPMVPSNICNVKVKMEHEEDSENELDFQTNDVLSMTADLNCTFESKSEEEGCDVRHTSEEFIKGMDCPDHPIMRIKGDRENPDKEIAVNRENSAFLREMDTLNSEEGKYLNEACDERETLQSKDCGTEFIPKKNSQRSNNSLKENILSRNVSHPVSDEGKSLENCSHADVKKSFSCLICKKCFKRKSDLKRHIGIHSAVKPYSCEVCNARFTLMDYLQSHMRRCHAGDLTCDICHKLFSCNKDLKVHMATHRVEKPYACDICHKSFPQIVVLQLHMRSHTGEKPYSCGTCQKSFISLKSLKRHNLTHTGEKKPYSCDICEKSYFDNPSLQKHMLTHVSEKSFICDVCKKSFSQEYKLERHRLTHTGVKSYPCNICTARFSFEAYLRKHEQIHIRGFSCDICQKSFYYNYSLKEHKLTHTGERPYTCDICQKSFSLRSALRSHKRIHSNVKPYSCDICQKTFFTKALLQNHSATHSGEKPFSCDICHRFFSLRRFLKKHMASHSTEKPYTCDICHKSFSQKCNIRNHILTHLTEKPYKCNICHKSFPRSGDLGKHKATHSTEKPYSCNFCSACFYSQGNLKKHEKIHTQPKPVCAICQKSFSEYSLKQHMLIHTGEKPFTCDICHAAFRYRKVLKYHIQTHNKGETQFV